MASEVSALRLQLSRLEDENEDIRRERDQFCAELSKFRQVNGTLESHIQDLRIENNDLRRKLSRIETTLPPPSRGSESAGRPSVKATASLKIIGDIDVIEVDGDSGTESSVSLPARGKITQTKPFVLLPFRKTAARPTPGSSVSTRSSSYRASSEQTNSSSMSISPSLGFVTRSKRRIGQVQDILETDQNKRRKEETQNRRDSAAERSEESPVPEPTAGPSIPSVEQRHTERAYNHSVASSASFPAQGGTLIRVSNRRANIKVKPAALCLSNETVSEYLQGCARLAINPVPSPCLFSRQFIGENYGGSQFTLLAKSTDKGMDFIFPTPDINPEMPTTPGNPGLLLSCRREMTEFTCTLFSRNALKPARWEYIGEYDSQLLHPLSAFEFTQQKQAMKAAWAKKILKAKKWPVYTAIRARIYLRKAGHQLTDDNIEAEVLRIQAKPTQGGSLNAPDVIEALERSDEKLDIIRMTCVSYDHRFVEDMNTRLKSWTPQNPGATSKKNWKIQGEIEQIG